jgi:hypothetical protein
LIDKSLCLSAAEKRDYAVQRATRQPLVSSCIFSLRFALFAAWRCEGQNYNEPAAIAQG